MANTPRINYSKALFSRTIGCQMKKLLFRYNPEHKHVLESRLASTTIVCCVQYDRQKQSPHYNRYARQLVDTPWSASYPYCCGEYGPLDLKIFY